MSDITRGLKAVVTAGSTIGEIDAVRFVEQIGLDTGAALGRLERFEIQNPFKGKLGLRIAEALHRRGVAVTLLTRADLLDGMSHSLPPSSIESFRTFGDFERMLPEVLARVQPDLVWQAAAVSDWVPAEVEGMSAAETAGKIESKADVLRVIFKKTPKLIDRIRPAVGDRATIVGFKLLVRVTEEEMAIKATDQIRRADTDYCVGNDNTLITKTCHPVRLFSRSGEVRPFSGTKVETADWLVDTIVTEHTAKVLE